MAKKHKLHVNKKFVTALVVVLLLLASVGAGMAVWWLQNAGKQNTPAPFDASTAKVPDVIHQATNTKDTAQSNQTLQTQLNQPGASQDDKYNILLQLGINAVIQGQTQQALDYYKQADAIQSTSVTSHLIAEQYAILKEADQAIAYYKKTITQLDPKATDYNIDKQDYESRIRDLGGQP